MIIVARSLKKRSYINKIIVGGEDFQKSLRFFALNCFRERLRVVVP